MRDLPPIDVLRTTRDHLHQVAEHVLAAARMRATGEFTLVPAAGGFGTPPLDDGRTVAVEGTELVVRSGGEQRRAPLTTVREAAALIGTEPGFPSAEPATPFEPDTPLELDARAAAVLAEWFTIGSEALRTLSDQLRDDHPTEITLFPEHFDVGITVQGVNFGASPGDADVEVPYVYVGPHGGPPAHDEYWNAEFGAYRTIHDVESVEEAVTFFRTGRERLLAASLER
jgi:hypothetical protein